MGGGRRARQAVYSDSGHRKDLEFLASVKTLHEANLKALARHYRKSAPWRTVAIERELARRDRSVTKGEMP